MDFSLFLTIVAAAVGFIVIIIRKFRSHEENKEFDSSSLSTSSPPPSSLSISSVPPSSTSHNWTYDVFPSFRGEDVRNNILSHIKRELERKGITPFNDNGINRGESIGHELISAIRGSKIAIILLSENYASSKWCLEELVEIMKCREDLGQTVMAIFYKVNPSDVKKLTGDFGKVFRKTCKGKTKEDIGRWKQALEKVATIAGYHLNNWDNEAFMIESIATDVSNKLMDSVPSRDFDNLVGMSTHMKNMEQLLRLGSNEVRMIGIWGPSGIGKSTIARVLFCQHSHDFQLSVFMENIKGRYPRPCFDEHSAKLQLQKEFLSQIINQKDLKINHLGVAENRLKDKRALVVLDDVDKLAQLDALAKETMWFGPGSWIIVTTQDKKILNAHGIDRIYEVGFPPDNEALQIFCMNDFGQKSPYDGFKKLAWEVTRLVGNLPLGLSVMGSHFKRMPKHEWEEELPRLRTRLDGDIESTLKFSYDALCDEDQDLFLHIACSFNGEQIEKVEEHLADNFACVKRNLRVLAEKSLISITDWGFISMHDLLVCLGREIVRKQHIHEPGQRQFLVDARDICQVLRNDTLGSRSVIGINLEYLESGTELNISDGAFEEMSNIQFLRLESHHHSSYVHYYLPPKLKLLHWERFPMTCLPSNFNTEFLVEIKMTYSNLEKLCEENKPIKNLKWLDLSNSSNLKELPDFSTATNLQELDLLCCSSLVRLPYSVGNAINLRKLNLSHCSSLVELPSSVWNIVNLLKLNLSDCSSLVRLPSSSGNAIKLKELDLCGCTSLIELPSSMENAINLEILNLEGCLHLLELPSSIDNLRELYLKDCSSLVELSSSVINALNLKCYSFSGCSSLVELPSCLGNATYLDKFVNLIGCSSLQRLPSSIGNMTNLTRLSLQKCSSLVELPSSIGNLTNLRSLYLNECSSLVELPSSIGNLTNLGLLHLNRCSSLVELPFSIGNMKLCEDLSLSECSNLVELPSSIRNLHNLRVLYLRGCSKLKALPININMKSLYLLDITDCSSLKSFPEISTNIEVLWLSGTAIEEIPPSIRSWFCLDTLHVSYCENLRKSRHAFDSITGLHLSDTGIQEIAPWVKEMSRLERLVIKGCTKLVSLPQLPDSLKIIDAENCESLERLDCFVNKKKFHELSFVNCFKLNQEARDLIIKTLTENAYISAVFPGDKVPTYFTYRGNGSSLSMKWNGFDTHFPTILISKVCFLLVSMGDAEVGDWEEFANISYRIKDKLNGVIINSGDYCLWDECSPPSKEHLVIFEFRTTVTSAESVFEFECNNKKWEIEECGLCPLGTAPCLTIE